MGLDARADGLMKAESARNGLFQYAELSIANPVLKRVVKTMPSTLPATLIPRIMSNHDPYSEAEWMIETIIDDFAESLDDSDRSQFYARLAELIAERRERIEQHQEEAETEPPTSQHIH